MTIYVDDILRAAYRNACEDAETFHQPRPPVAEFIAAAAGDAVVETWREGDEIAYRAVWDGGYEERGWLDDEEIQQIEEAAA